MNLAPQQLTELLGKLVDDYGFKETDDYLQKGTCPNCGKKELFISKNEPWRICCNRLNNCGYSESVFELYKNSLFANWSEHYKPTPDNPNATADAYLQNKRGFQLGRIQGLYSQEYYVNFSQHSTATIRFVLSDGKAQWERFIDGTDNFDKQKCRSLGKHKGLWWQMPDEDFSKIDTVFIVEGIFDAIALNHAGYTAIASISCGHYPVGFFEMLKQLQLTPQIIYALDNDVAGEDGLRKHVPKARKAGFWTKAALPPPGKDWNDLWLADQLNDNAITEARYRGDLLLANTASKAARIEYRKSGMNSFPITHNEKTYWFNLDTGAYQQAVSKMEDEGTWNPEDNSSVDEALKESATVQEIVNCKVTPLYYQRDLETDDSRYFVKISRPDAPNIVNTFTGRQLSSAADFKRRLLSICPGALYEGNSKQLNRIIKTEYNNLYTVDKIDYTGYVPDLDAWIYRDFGVKNGRVIPSNEEQFIALDNHHSIKTIADIRINFNNHPPDFSWLEHYIGAFGEKGLVALAHFTGTLFVEQIRKQQQSYPFLEATGDAGTGKTTMLVFLWRLLGRSSYEGFDAGKASFKGRGREFNKVSGFPIVLIEGDRHTGHNKQFDFEELKDLYNGRAVYTRAVRTNGLETYAPPFRGSIIIAQNAHVSGSEAVLSRIIPLFFSSQNINIDSKRHVDALNKLDVENLSSYLTFILKNTKPLLEKYFEQWGEFETRLSSNNEIRMFRLIHNGAQMMSMVNALASFIGISADWVTKTLSYIEQISVERQQWLASDDPRVIEFWDTIEYLSSRHDDYNLNHSSDNALMAISLPHIESCFKYNGMNMMPRIELCTLLEKGKKYEYIGRKTVRSSVLKKPVKCLVFRKGK